MRLLSIIIMVAVFAGCNQGQRKAEMAQKRSHPSQRYNYVIIDTARLNYFETDYLPVYSDIYYENGTQRFPITATVSLRNISLTDSAYVLSANYFDSYGHLLDAYIDSVLLLSPLESVELVVEEGEKAGGAGANFIIEWGATRNSGQLLIQSVMISTFGQQGVSFLSEAKVIKAETRNRGEKP